MHWRICGATLALLSFAAVCLNGFLQGHSFTSVTKHSLLAMAVGGITGILAAVAIRYVVREEFVRKHLGSDRQEGKTQASGVQRTTESAAGTDAAETQAEPASQGTGSAGH